MGDENDDLTDYKAQVRDLAERLRVQANDCLTIISFAQGKEAEIAALKAKLAEADRNASAAWERAELNYRKLAERGAEIAALNTERERVIAICKGHFGHACDRDHTGDDCIESIIAEIAGRK